MLGCIRRPSIVIYGRLHGGGRAEVVGCSSPARQAKVAGAKSAEGEGLRWGRAGYRAPMRRHPIRYTWGVCCRIVPLQQLLARRSHIENASCMPRTG